MRLNAPREDNLFHYGHEEKGSEEVREEGSSKKESSKEGRKEKGRSKEEGRKEDLEEALNTHRKTPTCDAYKMGVFLL